MMCRISLRTLVCNILVLVFASGSAARRGRRVIFLMTALTIIATGIQVVLDRDQTREYLRQWNEAGLYRQLSDSTNDLDEIIFNPEARAQFSVAKKSFLYEYFQKWQAGEVELPFDLPFLPKPTPPGS
uniref:Uncharacterized protein n=1 Tax=Chromera velia CCMP2878 TaxID=1169474 RepID=A0A0G4EZK2_9ALVE|eukprot:Cvel_14437.t1-p1 / transcript=Cvel_14437.t1 / gene=Cvel_14437 / organism=Chromera_velia_CCMP2878 / gene_product=hypothetical protein / transcript_product=hypothetical protein / location=Cvel_scaffold1027:28707-30348(-) / protein_length=127 / sequence_SO=supercontig / SO=protein_coding / is_pseudo=false